MPVLSFADVKKRLQDSYEHPNNVSVEVPNPMVSVYVATYQHSLFIRDCLDGILMQETAFPFEVVVGEDFSTDGTREIVFEYAEKYPYLIRVVTADYNVKQEANRIRCLKACRGRYIAMCDGDDYWTDPQKIQKQVAFLESRPDYVMCYHSYRNKVDGKLGGKLKPLRPRDYSGDELIATPSGMAVATKMVRNVFSTLRDEVLFRFYNDFPMNAYLGTLGNCKFLSDIKPSVYTHHAGGVWSSADSQTKHHRHVKAKVMIYLGFLELNDERIIKISLRSMIESLLEKWPYLDPEYKQFLFASSRFWVVYKGLRFELYLKPLGRVFKRRILKLLGVNYPESGNNLNP